jgi:hypothetical protein
VGDPGEGAQATSHRYHRGDCYVLDQEGNRGRTRKVVLADLPEGYGPCQICAPGSRSSTAAGDGPARGEAHRPTGVQPGHRVEVEDVDTGRVSEYRIASAERPLDSGKIPSRSPLGAALVGNPARSMVEFTPTQGGIPETPDLAFRARFRLNGLCCRSAKAAAGP